MHCGKPLRAALGTLPATLDPDLCPLCHQRGALVRTVFNETTDDLAKELAPPGKPLSVLILGAAEEAAVTGHHGPGTTEDHSPPSLASIAALGYSGVVWALGGLAIVLLLLASRKAASNQDLLAAIQHGTSVGAVISTHGAAGVPYLLGALTALAAAFGLLAIKVTVSQLWEGSVDCLPAGLEELEPGLLLSDRPHCVHPNGDLNSLGSVEELHHLITHSGRTLSVRSG